MHSRSDITTSVATLDIILVGPGTPGLPYEPTDGNTALHLIKQARSTLVINPAAFSLPQASSATTRQKSPRLDELEVVARMHLIQYATNARIPVVLVTPIDPDILAHDWFLEEGQHYHALLSPGYNAEMLMQAVEEAQRALRQQPTSP